MKKTLLSLGLILSSFVFSQVGINTSSPTSTLDVAAKNATGTTANVDGLLVPRVDRQRAQSMTGVPAPTLIYVNNIATGTQTGTTANVDAEGYYFFNGTLWVKLHNPTNIANLGTNIYNSDGSLTGNRLVTQGANTLSFTSTASNAFSVDGNTFSVNASTNKVGVGTISPTGKLSVSGSGAGLTPMLTLTNTNVAGNPMLNIYPGYTSTGAAIVEGNQYAVVFDQDPGVTSGPTQALYDFHGQVRYVNASALSDRRLKKDIKDLNEYGLSEVMKLQPRRYLMMESAASDIGLIAQELKAVVPEIVYGDEKNGLLSVDYSKISLVLINAIKEQQKMIEKQGQDIEQLKTEIKNLKIKKN